MFAGLHHLKSLDLSSNKLTQIVDVFSRLPALEQLNLRANALVSFKPETFKVTNLFPIFSKQKGGEKKDRKSEWEGGGDGKSEKEGGKEKERSIDHFDLFVLGLGERKLFFFFFFLKTDQDFNFKEIITTVES